MQGGSAQSVSLSCKNITYRKLPRILCGVPCGVLNSTTDLTTEFENESGSSDRGPKPKKKRRCAVEAWGHTDTIDQ